MADPYANPGAVPDGAPPPVVPVVQPVAVVPANQPVAVVPASQPVAVVPASQPQHGAPTQQGGMMAGVTGMLNNNGPAKAIAPVGKDYGKSDAQKMNQTLGDISWLAGKQRFLLRQRFEALEAIANLVGFGMIEFSNKYDFYDADTGQPLLYAAEESSCFQRACCKPHHEAKLHVFDVREGINQKLFTAQKPFKCNCCIWLDCCTQKQNAIAGDRQLGESGQTFPCGGYCTPTLDVKDVNRTTQYKVIGPFCCIGGLIETCFDQSFSIKDTTSGEEVGRIVHMKPEDLKEGVKQFVGDSDNFLMELPAELPAETVANFLGTMLLLDYLFFEGGPVCGPTPDGGFSVNCFNVYCCGCIYPCKCESGPPEQGGPGGRGGRGQAMAGGALMGAAGGGLLGAAMGNPDNRTENAMMGAAGGAIAGGMLGAFMG